MKYRKLNKMSYIFRDCIIILIILFCISNVYSSSLNEKNKNILILNSYHDGYKWTNDVTENVVEKIANRYPYANIFIEYMDTKRYVGDEYFNKLKEIYIHKYGKMILDVIVVVDDNAYNFIKENHDELFPDVPVVFCGINYSFQEKDFKPVWLTGVNEEPDIINTVDLVVALKPQTKKIFLICDNTLTGNKIKSLIHERLSYYEKPVEFIFNEDMNYNELLGKIENLTEEYSVIYVLFLKDKSGEILSFAESVERISKVSKMPVFGLWDFFLGYGIVGGKLISGKFQGQSAGEKVVQILDGFKIPNIPIEFNTPCKYMFDHYYLDKYNIKLSTLPDTRIIINAPITFYDKHKSVIVPTYIGIGFLLIIILVLVVNIYKRKKAESLLKLSWIDMESKVEDKTKELKEINKNLREEIQERLKRENELEHSEEKFHLLADNIPGVIYLCNNDEDYSYLYLNEEIYELTGYAVSEYTSEEITLKEICHPDDVDELYNKLYSLNGENISFHHIYRLKHKNGDWRWIEEFGVGIFEEDELKYIEGYLRDITDKKYAEDQIKENLIKYQTLFNLSPTGILIENENGIILEANEKTCKQMGYSQEELVGKHIKIFAPPEDEEFVLRNIQYIMSGQKMDHTVESVTKNGEIRFLSISESKIALGGGKEGIIVVTIDITERKKIEDALERARILLQSSLEQIPAGVIVSDSENVQLVLANNEASNILGQSIENIYKISLEGLSKVNWKQYDVLGAEIPPLEWPLSRALIKGETTLNMEMLIKRSDGSERWILSNATPVKNYKDEIIAGIDVFTDITNIKEMEKEREELIVNLKNALEEVKALSGMLPICSSCKKIRDDRGYWNQIESYIADHSDAQFSHGICPDCVQKLYPQYSKKILKDKEK